MAVKAVAARCVLLETILTVDSQVLRSQSNYLLLLIAEVFKNVVVMVSDHANTTLNTEGPDVCKYIQGAPDLVQQFDCSQRMYGRYVSIGMLDTGFLNAYEIEVIGWE